MRGAGCDKDSNACRSYRYSTAAIADANTEAIWTRRSGNAHTVAGDIHDDALPDRHCDLVPASYPAARHPSNGPTDLGTVKLAVPGLHDGADLPGEPGTQLLG